jgi:hypothetical protein
MFNKFLPKYNSQLTSKLFTVPNSICRPINVFRTLPSNIAPTNSNIYKGYLTPSTIVTRLPLSKLQLQQKFERKNVLFSKSHQLALTEHPKMLESSVLVVLLFYFFIYSTSPELFWVLMFVLFIIGMSSP